MLIAAFLESPGRSGSHLSRRLVHEGIAESCRFRLTAKPGRHMLVRHIVIMPVSLTFSAYPYAQRYSPEPK